MRNILALAAATVISTITGAVAAPGYSTSVTIGYDPNAPTSNFNSPGTTNNETAYTVRTGEDSANFYVDVTANPPVGTTPDQFANIYFGGLHFSPGLVFEVTNNRVSTTSNPGVYFSLAGTGFTYSDSLDNISFSLPFSFLETDPLGIGFTKVNAGDEVRVSYSQSFGYSFVGGTANYGQGRLGEQFVPALAVPEPMSLLLLGSGFAAIVAVRRRGVGLWGRNLV